MRLSVSEQRQVCLPCLLKYGRRTFSTASSSVTDSAYNTPRRNRGSSRYHNASPNHGRDGASSRALLEHNGTVTISESNLHREPLLTADNAAVKATSLPSRRTEHPIYASGITRYGHNRAYFSTSARNAGTSTSAINLSELQMEQIQVLHDLKPKLQNAFLKVSKEFPERQSPILVEEVVKKLSQKDENEKEKALANLLEQVYSGKPYQGFKRDFARLTSHRKVAQRKVKDTPTKKMILELGLDASEESDTKSPTLAAYTSAPVGIEILANSPALTNASAESASQIQKQAESEKSKKPGLGRSRKKRVARSGGSSRPVKPRSVRNGLVVRRVLSDGKPVRVSTRPRSKVPTKTGLKVQKIAILDGDLLDEVKTKDLELRPLPIGQPSVPTLSFDLSRVLFNQGIYQLQDTRSRVYNFDPYLTKIMSVSEFDYDALNKYITSSEDQILLDLAKDYNKRYIGSSSSMSSALGHFHYLLSGWREINLSYLSRGFKDDGKLFTRIQRGPTAIFLRWKDGVYAVDADKEYDSANILMSLGKSMEKLFTLEKPDFEKYRKSTDRVGHDEVPEGEREAYHYSELGQFLLRSQLDAYDPRLPGTGMFDLKTRAVAAIRMNVKNHVEGSGYQIRNRFGTWESFEREYYDMIRSAFLKYSLQVRMGRMDGIFVAYHNIDRIFGFQYMPLPEIDTAIHGQSDRSLGDREFCISVKLMNELFNRATAAFPEQSLRFHFETREATKTEPAPYMYVFAEPVNEEEIQRIQDLKKEEIAAYEQRIFNPQSAEDIVSSGSETVETKQADSEDSIEEVAEQKAPQEPPTIDTGSQAEASAAEVPPTESMAASNADTATGQEVKKALLGMKLIIRNRVNGEAVLQPSHLTSDDNWTVEYTITHLAEAQAWRHYGLCKNRRRSTLTAVQDQDVAASYYLRRLADMSKAGAIWRKHQDEVDAQRQPVVLYQNKSNDMSASAM